MIHTRTLQLISSLLVGVYFGERARMVCYVCLLSCTKYILPRIHRKDVIKGGYLHQRHNPDRCYGISGTRSFAQRNIRVYDMREPGIIWKTFSVMYNHLFCFIKVHMCRILPERYDVLFLNNMSTHHTARDITSDNNLLPQHMRSATRGSTTYPASHGRYLS